MQRGDDPAGPRAAAGPPRPHHVDLEAVEVDQASHLVSIRGVERPAAMPSVGTSRARRSLHSMRASSTSSGRGRAPDWTWGVPRFYAPHRLGRHRRTTRMRWRTPGERVTSMSLEGIVIGTLGVLLGAAFCLAGFRFFLILLPIWGLFTGLHGRRGCHGHPARRGLPGQHPGDRRRDRRRDRLRGLSYLYWWGAVA